MPDGKTHKLVGAGSGAVYAAYRAKDQSNRNFWLETIGGGLGGYVGGILPDRLEPAISSYHRDVFHSATAGAGVLRMTDLLLELQAACRENAEKCRAIPMVPQNGVFVPIAVDPVSKAMSDIAEMLWLVLAGFVNGLAAGYVSHLALDAVTGERSIPLLTKGL